MKLISYLLLGSLSVLAGACGSSTQSTKTQASSRLQESSALTCDPQKVPSKLYTFVGGLTSDDPNATAKHHVAGFVDQNCRERFVYLKSCDFAAARTLLAFEQDSASEMRSDDLNAFLTPDSGDYYKNPHISCSEGTGVKPNWEEGHKAEPHISYGFDGFSTLDVVSKPEIPYKMHYQVSHSCPALRARLNVESFLNVGEPVSDQPPTLGINDDLIHLNCGEYRPKMPPKAGWTLIRTSSRGLFYIARYRATETSPAVDLWIWAVDHQILRNIRNDPLLERKLEADLLRRFGLSSNALVKADIGLPPNQILFDICTTDSCTNFAAGSVTARIKNGRLSRDDSTVLQLQGHILPNNKDIAYAIQSQEAGKPVQVSAFATCSQDQDLSYALGLSRPQTLSRSWLNRLAYAAENIRDLQIQEVPCLKSRVCRKELNDGRDLSASKSDVYKGISTLMLRGNCEDATDLEFRISGNLKVKSVPWKIGNLDASIQRPYERIRIIGTDKATITLDCTNCSDDVNAALELTGSGDFTIENLAFESNFEPKTLASQAIKINGSSRDTSFVSMKGITIKGSTPKDGETKIPGFTRGLSINQAQVALWNVDVEVFHVGIEAGNARVSVFGDTPLDHSLQDSSRVKVLSRKDIVDLAGITSSLHRYRALRAEDSLVLLNGATLDAPFPIGLFGTRPSGENLVTGKYNRLTNSSSELKSRSAAVFANGYGEVNLQWNHIFGLGGLIEFDSMKIGSAKDTRVEFRNYYPGSHVTNPLIIRNPTLGTSNYSEQCPGWDEGVCRL